MCSLIADPQDFPGGTVDKNPPAFVGDVKSIPGVGRFHVPLNLYSTTTDPAHLEPVHHKKRSHSNEKPMDRKEEWSCLAATSEVLHKTAKT